MDYYAAWPVWKMPKWLGIALGGIFSVIAGGSIWLIVDLTRPPQPRPVVSSAPAVAAPKVAESAPTAPAAPTTPALVPATPEKATAAVASLPPEKKVAKKTRDLSSAHRRSILAKHESKATRQTKTDFDRLLGL